MDDFREKIEEIRRNSKSISSSLDKIKQEGDEMIRQAEVRSGKTMIDIIDDWKSSD